MSVATIPTPLFRTARLHCRRLRAADLDAMAEVYGDADAMRWVDVGEPLPRAGCAQWIRVTHGNYVRRGYGMSALETRAGEVIGFIGLVHPGGQPEAEIKYALHRRHWGQGLATEAARGLLAWGAAVHGLRHVTATTAPENLASHRVLLKAGLQRGRLRQNDDGSFTQCFDGWIGPC